VTDTFTHECETLLRSKWAAVGTEVTISTAPPIIITPYTQDGLTCPHGITYWMEPTSEQIAQWARDGVE